MNNMNTTSSVADSGASGGPRWRGLLAKIVLPTALFALSVLAAFANPADACPGSTRGAAATGIAPCAALDGTANDPGPGSAPRAGVDTRDVRPDR